MARTEDVDIQQSENKMAWEVKGLSLADIHHVLMVVSGTQFQGKTVYCVPIVSNVSTENEPNNSSQSESGEQGNKENQNQNDKDKEDGGAGPDGEAPGVDPNDGAPPPPPAEQKSDQETDDDDDFEKVSRRESSAEKKLRRKQKKLEREKEKEQERLLQLKLVQDAKGAGKKGQKRKDIISPGSNAARTRSTKQKQETGQGSQTKP